MQMADDGLSAQSARRKTRLDGQPRNKRRIWSRYEEEFLVNAMKELIMEPKWKLDNGAFRNGFYSEIEKKIVQRFPGTDLRASPHIDSKVKIWKKHYNMLQDMLRTSEIGWDDQRKVVQIDSEDVWNNYILREPEAASMRNKEFPYYEDWLLLFGRDRATGEGAEAMSELAINMMTEKADFHLSQDFDATDLDIGVASQCPQTRAEPSTQLGSTSKGGKKRGRANEGAIKVLVEITTSFGAFVSETGARMDKIANTMHVAQDLRAARMSLDEELQKLPIDDEDRLSLLMDIDENDRYLDIFFGLKDEVSRVRFVQRLLARMKK